MISATVPPAISCFFGAEKKRQLMAGSATYDLPTMISENWIHFGWFSRLFGAKNRFHAFFVTQKERKSEQEIETLRKAMDYYDKARPFRVLSLKLRKKLHERRKITRKWWVFFAKNWIILQHLFPTFLFFKNIFWNHSRSP